MTIFDIAMCEARKAALEVAKNSLKSCDYFLKERAEKHSNETLNYYRKEKHEALEAIKKIEEFFQ